MDWGWMTTECSLEVTIGCRKLRHKVHNLVSAPNSDQIKQQDKTNGKCRWYIALLSLQPQMKGDHMGAPDNKWEINGIVLKITGCEDAETIQVSQVKIVRKPWDPKDAGNLLTNK